MRAALRIEEKEYYNNTSFPLDSIKKRIKETASLLLWLEDISFLWQLDKNVLIMEKNEIFTKEIEALGEIASIGEKFQILKNSLWSFTNQLLNEIKENKFKILQALMQEVKSNEIKRVDWIEIWYNYDNKLLNDIKEYEKSNTIAETLFFDIVNIVKKVWQIKQQWQGENAILDNFLTQLLVLLKQFEQGDNILENLLSYFKNEENDNKFAQTDNHDSKLIQTSYTSLKDIYFEEYREQEELVQNPNFTSQLIAIRGTIELILLQLEQGIYEKVNTWNEINKETIWNLEKLRKICHSPSLSERLRKILEELKGKDHSIREEKFLKIMQLLQGKWKDWLYTQSMLESNKKIFTKIKESWSFEMGEASFFIPWAVNALRKLIEYWIISPENIDIKLWQWVNIQEGLQLRKWWESESMLFFDKQDTIDKLKLHIWNGSSLAHVVTFFAKENKEKQYTIKINIWENSFVWISSMVGNGLKMWNNSTIWFQSHIGEDVRIGNNVLIGTGCKIDDWVEIWDNYLVPNFAHITSKSPTVSYEDFINHPEKYHTAKYTENGRRSFIIDLWEWLSEKERGDELKRVEEQLSQSHNEKLSSINTNYAGMVKFNKNAVVPENRLFSALSSIFAYLEREIPTFKATQEISLESSLDINRIVKIKDIKKKQRTKEQLKEITYAQRLYPKNKEKFIFEILPQVLKLIEEEKLKEAKDMLEKNLSEPKIIILFTEEVKEKKRNLEPVFTEKFTKKLLGKVISTGSVFIMDDSGIVYNSYLRGDELGEWEEIIIWKNAILKNCVAHGWGNKTVIESSVDYTVIHGATTIEDSQIWNPNHPSTLHNTTIKKLQASEGDIVCVWATIENAIFTKWVKISWGWQEWEIIIKNSYLWKWVSVNPWAKIINTNINIPNFYIGKGVVLEDIWDIRENNLQEIQQKLWERYQITEHSIILKEENKINHTTQKETPYPQIQDTGENPFDVPTNMQIISDGIWNLSQNLWDAWSKIIESVWEIVGNFWNTVSWILDSLWWKK